MNGEPRLGDGPERRSDPSDEQALWVEWTQARSLKARERLFALHFPLALRIAKQCFFRWTGGGAELADLRQLASAGLLEAIDRFDPGLGVPFRAYAGRRIRGAVLDGLTKASELREQIAAKSRARRERLASLSAESRDAPSGSRDALRRLVEIAVGLALGFMLEGANLYIEEKARDDGASAYEKVAWREIARRLGAEVANLPERERAIIQHHYEGALTFEQIGRLLGVSKGRIAQMHKTALGRLRERLARREGRLTE